MTTPYAALLRHNVSFLGPDPGGERGAVEHGAGEHGAGDAAPGPLVVLVHGFGCDQTVWKDVAARLTQAHRVMMFDHSGCGLAAPQLYDRARHARLDGYAEDMVRLFDDLGLSGLRLVVHSVSAMIAAIAAIARPDLIAELVMIGPSACYLNHPGYAGGFERETVEEILAMLDDNFLGWANSFAPLATGNPDRPELASDFAWRLSRNDPEIASAFARVTFLTDCRALLPRLTCPTLVVQTNDDPIAPDAAVRFVHEAVAGSRLVRMSASGHCPHISAPEELSALLLAHFAAAPLAPAPADGRAG